MRSIGLWILYALAAVFAWLSGFVAGVGFSAEHIVEDCQQRQSFRTAERTFECRAKAASGESNG